jgi:hypothetical protein
VESAIALVEAPTGLTGFRLVMRFPETTAQNRQDGEGRWTVRVPVRDEAAVETVLERVQAWMREQQIEQTTVRVGPEVYRVKAAPGRTSPGTLR